MRAVLVPLAFAVALAVPVGAQDCVVSDASPDVCVYEVIGGPLPCRRDIGTLFPPVSYWDWDNCAVTQECIVSFWIYDETNGIFWLQRDDDFTDNTCGGQIESDTIVF